MAGKVIVALLVLLPVLAHVGYAAAVSTFASYYVTVDDFIARPSATPLRVGGQIVAGSIQYDNASRTMHFQVSGDKASLDVLFRGPVPDSFRDGVTAIVEGARGPNGVFTATSVSIRCPHQYLPAI